MKSILVATVALIYLGNSSAAEGIAWRSDYAKAVQEAAEKKRPILLDFGTESCFYCKKLDKTTFLDPAVIRLLGEGFVAIKIDADRDPKLAQAMRIESYPTLVVAGPDGAVLASNPGYLDAAGMTRFLQGSLAKLPKPQERGSMPSGMAKADGASVLLSQAKKDLQDGFYLCCVERCDRLARLHPEAAVQAQKLAQQAVANGGEEIRELVAGLRHER